MDEPVIIITGGGRGIGETYAKHFGSKGRGVVIAEIDAASGEKVAKTITERGGQALAVATDVSDRKSVDAMVEQAIEKFGRIDALVNNAVFIDMVPWDEVSDENWAKTLGVNVIGSYYCARAVTPAMRKRGKGHIVNTASGHFFKPGPEVVAYAASKGGIVGLTRALARELGEYRITVNCVSPGLTRTEHAASAHGNAHFDQRASERFIKRWEYPEDLIGAVEFFTSDASSFITGQLLSVDGGQNIH